LAATEVVSALARKRREGALAAPAFTRAKQRLAGLERAWSEVTQYDLVRTRARRLLELHPLRAADALHLAAALVAAEERTHLLDVVTFDERLAEAAGKEGFRVLST
jgi:predicted nucleic acid-binding protein